MESGEDIEMQLWGYLDGTVTDTADHQKIAYLIVHDSMWKQKYQELSVLHTGLSMHIDDDMPSMSFSRNVMGAIAQNEIAKPAGKYINLTIIRGIATMFIVGLAVCLVYACTKANWTLPNNASADILSDPFKNFSLKPYSSMVINIFMGINIILILLLADKLFHKKRYAQKEL